MSDDDLKALAREQARIMLAWADGAEIEFQILGDEKLQWNSIPVPSWTWDAIAYRIASEHKPVTKPTVPWEALDKSVVAVAWDCSGIAYGYWGKPPEMIEDRGVWNAHSGFVRLTDILANLDPGTCDWKDSLVLRPEGE